MHKLTFFLLALPAMLCFATDLKIDDFESKNYSTFWTVEGDAFGATPSAEQGRQQRIKGHSSKYLANSFHNDDAGLGKLTSKVFKIERKFISFLIGGGAHKGKTCLNLIVDGKVVHSAEGDNANSLKKVSFDVRQFKQRNASIEIVDSHVGSWGYIMVDNIIQTDGVVQKQQKKSIGFKVPDNYDVDLFADNQYVENPVSIAVDTKGRVYVAEARRFLRGVEDTRKYNAWFLDELAINDLQGRLDLYKKWTSKGMFKEGHFTEYSERIQTLIDSDGDGKADQKKLYAGEFNHPLDGNGSSILLGNNGEMYYANIPHIWKLYDKDGDGVSESREKLISGFGFRNGVNGHDLHGLEWGVDGRLYFSNGDRGYGVKTKEGDFLLDSERGAVFRCEPDGSNLEIFTVGNRNPQDLAFDQYGNLFTVDNNRGRGDRSRVCYLVEQGDYSWNSGYENKTTFFRAATLNRRKGPRASDSWATEGDWKMPFEGQAAYCIPSIYYIDGGSAGITFNPGRSLGPALDQHFIYSAYQRGIFTFKFIPEGAGLQIENVKNFWRGGSIMDTEFSTDGKLYVADYVSTSNPEPGKTKGSIYVMKEPQFMKHPSVISADRLLKQGFRDVSEAALYNNLFHDDMRVRLQSQFELASRKSSAVLLKALQQKQNELARLHGLWGLGQMSRKDVTLNRLINPFVKDENWRVRAQVAKVLGESADSSSFAVLKPLLDDSNMRVQFFAAIAAGKLGAAQAVQPLVKLAKKNADKDTFLRHAIVTGLTYSAAKNKIYSYADSSSAAVRRVVLLALTRLRDPGIVEFMSDQDKTIVQEAARAIDRTREHKIVEKAAVALARYKNVKPDISEIDQERILQWNFRTGDFNSARRVADFSLNEKVSSRLRQIALHDLARWHEEMLVDPVIGQIREVNAERADTRDLLIDTVKALMSSVSNDNKLSSLLKSMALELNISLDKQQIITQVLDSEEDIAIRLDLYRKLIKAQDTQLNFLTKRLLEDPSKAMRLEAWQTLFNIDTKAFNTLLQQKAQKGKDLQLVYSTIAALKNCGMDNVLTEGLRRLMANKHPLESQLDLLAACEVSENAQVKKLLADYYSSLPGEDKFASYEMFLAGGDAANGKKLVYEQGVGQCMICHKIQNKGGIVAPDLSNIGNKKSATGQYILESIIAPSAFIVPGYGNITVSLKNGDSLIGSVIKDDDRVLILKLADGSTQTIKADDIQAKTANISSMPSMKNILKKDEIRDIVAYLQTLKEDAEH